MLTNVPEVEAKLLSVEEGADVPSPEALRVQGVAQATTPLDRPAGGEGWRQGVRERGYCVCMAQRVGLTHHGMPDLGPLKTPSEPAVLVHAACPTGMYGA